MTDLGRCGRREPPASLYSPPMITWEQAIAEGQKLINAKCKEQGINPLTGHDIAVLAAHRVGEKTYNAALLKHGDNPEFNAQAIQFAAKCIAQALLG